MTVKLTHPDSSLTVETDESHAGMYETQGWARTPDLTAETPVAAEPAEAGTKKEKGKANG